MAVLDPSCSALRASSRTKSVAPLIAATARRRHSHSQCDNDCDPVLGGRAGAVSRCARVSPA